MFFYVNRITTTGEVQQGKEIEIEDVTVTDTGTNY